MGTGATLKAVVLKLQHVVLKLQHALESPGSFVKAQIAGLTPGVSDSVGLARVYWRRENGNNFHLPQVVGDADATAPGSTLRTTVLKNSWHFLVRSTDDGLV